MRYALFLSVLLPFGSVAWLAQPHVHSSAFSSTLRRPKIQPLQLSSVAEKVEEATTIAPEPITFKLGDSKLDARQTEVLQALTDVIDPDLGADIVSLGFIKDLLIGIDGVVSFNVELTTPACPVKEQFKQDCTQLVLALPWATKADITMTAQPVSGTAFQNAFEAPTGLSQVANIIAVSSCKGGVGKSTTAVNLAFSLKALGAKVGVLDADIYGPSLPTMVTPDTDAVEFVGSQIKPLEAHGVKLMSFGYVNSNTAAMRGPMVMQLLNQFVSLTSWGALDYLVLDMPPGTGDVQLTLTQILNITCAVVVTTPQRLSFVDVVKGIDLFDRVAVPSVAVVENMASFTSPVPSLRANDKEAWALLQADFAAVLAMSSKEVGEALFELNQVHGDKFKHQESKTAEEKEEDPRAKLLTYMALERAEACGGEEHRIFGEGHRQRLSEMWGIENTISLPLYADAATAGDKGVPLVVAQPEHPLSLQYAELASSVVREVAKLRFGNHGAHPLLRWDEELNLLLVDEGVSDPVTGESMAQEVDPVELRLLCRCAACVEELTGRPILDQEAIRSLAVGAVRPTDFGPVGNYALAVTWSNDGHKSLYPYRAFIHSRDKESKKQGRRMPEAASSVDPANDLGR